MTDAQILWPIVWPSLAALGAMLAALGIFALLARCRVSWSTVAYVGAYLALMALIVPAMPWGILGVVLGAVFVSFVFWGRM